MNLSGNLDRIESRASNQDVGLQVEIPQVDTMSNGDSEDAGPRVAPLPKVRSPVRSPQRAPHDPVTPGTKSQALTSPSKKKSPLPRVAMLAQPSPKPKNESKKSPPPFRAGGKVGSGWNRDTVTRKPTPTRETSSSSVTRLETSRRVSSSSLASRSSTTDAMILPRRTSSPHVASKRTIAKPPENIKRAIKESKELSKMDSLDPSEDADMQNLRSILKDIKTIKSELGVETGDNTVENENPDGELLSQDNKGEESPKTATTAEVTTETEGIAGGQHESENMTVSYMSEVPAELGPDEAEGPRREVEELQDQSTPVSPVSPAHEPTPTTPTTHVVEVEDQDMTEPISSNTADGTKKQCACCAIM